MGGDLAHTVIRGGRLLNPGDRDFEPNDILIEGERIIEVGPPGLPAPADARTIDAQGMLLHPGLINAHTHGHGSLAKGMGDRWTLELLLTAAVWTYAGRGLEDRHLSTKLAAAEMALKGCTACYDLNMELPGPTPEGLAAMAQAHQDVGIRAVLAPAIADKTFYQAVPGLEDALPETLRRRMPSPSPAVADAAFAAMRAALRGWRSEQVRLAIAPTIPMHCSDEFLVRCRDLAAEFDLATHSHVAESKVQAVYARQRYGRSIVAHLAELGLIGPRFTVAHGVWLVDEEMRILGERGASVAHNPGSNMRIGSGLADVRRMLERGINVGIGTDGANCADHQNMYEAMRLASLVSKVQGPVTREWLSTDEVWRLATIGGARVLGLEGRIGHIAPGHYADIVFLDARHPNWLPLNNGVNQLVHSEDGTAIRRVMAGGKIIVENGRLLTVDVDRLAAETERARLRLERHNVDNKALFEGLAAVVNEFCPGLARQHYPINRYGACDSSQHD